MKHQLAKALEDDGGRTEPSDRILRAAFFRKAPLQAGTQPNGGAPVLRLDEHRARGDAKARPNG